MEDFIQFTPDNDLDIEFHCDYDEEYHRKSSRDEIIEQWGKWNCFDFVTED